MRIRNLYCKKTGFKNEITYKLLSIISGTGAVVVYCTFSSLYYNSSAKKRWVIVLAYLGRRRIKFHAAGLTCWFFISVYFKSCIWPQAKEPTMEQRQISRKPRKMFPVCWYERALFDDRTGLSFTIAAGLRQSIHPRVRVPWYTWSYFIVTYMRLGDGVFLYPSTQRYYRRLILLLILLYCYMFRSYDHLQTENILLARITQLTTDPLVGII
jgi:hypothetical protein